MRQEISETICEALRPFDPLFRAFNDAGYQLYAVGGCVRDWLLGKVPKDIDFTTDAVPEETKSILADHGYKVLPVGEVFGTIATIIHKQTYEITTYRVKESYTRGSRHPMVCYGKSLDLDLERRDLTINAMAATETGEIVDPFGGLEDLENGILRVPRSSYDRTLDIFGDDPLRILRLSRFKARLGFSVAQEATKAAKNMAGAVLTVSHERWFAEINGLLCAEKPDSGLNWLWETGIWQLLFPEMALTKTICQRSCDLSGISTENADESLWDQTLTRICAAPVDSELRWAALFSLIGHTVTHHARWAEDVSAMLADALMLRLKMSRAASEAVMSILTLLPPGSPTYRASRELAIGLGKYIHKWCEFQHIRLLTLGDHASDEKNRFDQWYQAIKPFIDHPESADVRLPQDLSARISETLGFRGKTLGLCISHCREAVLDQILSESDNADAFVSWLKDNYRDM